MNTIFHDWTKAAACAIMIAAAPVASAAEGIFASDASGNLVAALSSNTTAPVILAQPVSQVVTPGGNAGFGVIARGSPPLGFQWRFNDADIPGATGDSLFLSGITTNQEGSYRVLVSNGGGTVLSGPALLQLDADGDGLPDNWERSYFGGLTNQTSSGDRDADGVSNSDEFLEGTNPTNAASLFPRLNLTVAGPGTVTVSPLTTKYAPGQIVGLTAVAAAGASFLGWTGDVTNSANPLSLTMDSTKDVTALFGLPLDVALDTTGFTWTSGGAAGWLGQTNTTHDLIDAAQSGPLGQGQQSWLQTTVVNSLPAALDFWWRLNGTVSPLGSDSLAILVNGVVQSGTLLNNVAWQQKAVVLAPGTNVVRWLYTKLSTAPRYLDIHNGGYVDQVALRPIAAISVADATLAEGHGGTNNAVFTLTLQEPVSIAASVRYFTTNGSATAGSDYVATSGTVNFAAGVATQAVVVPVVGDLNVEGDETFRLVLHTPTAGYLIDGEATATIHDDEIAPAGFALVSESCVSPNSRIDPGETVTVTLFLRNPGPLPTANLTATLVPASGVLPPSTALEYGVLPPDNSPVARTFTFTANGPCGSNLVATLALQDGPTNRGLASYTFSLGAITTTSNRFVGDALTIPALGPATNYPSSLVVGGIAGTVRRVTVTIAGLQHLNPDDLDILLVGPGGHSVMLLSDAGGTVDATGVSLTFDDGAAAFAADSSALISGVFKPSNYDTNTDALPGPAPAGPYASSLGTFNGVNPNGAWSLLVNDDTAGNAGVLAGGWSLIIETFDAACCTSPNQPDLAVTAALPGPVVVGHDATLVFTVLNQSAFVANNVSLTNTLPPGLSFISAGPSQGTATPVGSEVTASFGALGAGASATLALTVRPERAGAFTNSVTTYGVESDPNYANNALTAVVTAVVPTLAIADLTVADTTTNAMFAVALSTFSSQEITVRYHTTNGTAAAGLDFVATNGLLSFAPGVTTQLVRVPILADVISEANETFSVILTSPTNATVLDGTGVATITDDDQVPGIAIADVSVVEGHTGVRNAVFTVRLSAPSGQSATVAFATANGTAVAPGDFTARSGTLTFGVGVTTQTVAIAVSGDLALEADETFFLRLSNPVRATLTDTQAVATILDDELVAAGFTLISESCDPPNGVIDPGESVVVTFALRNPGPLETTNLTATLLANSQLLAPSGPVNLGVVPGDNSPAGATFSFAGNGYCGSNVTATLLLQEGTNSRGFVSYSFRLGTVDAECCADPGAAEIAVLSLTTATNTVVVGHDLAFTFTVTNRSLVTATGVIVTNWLPPDTTFVSARGSQGDCVQAGGVVTCFLGDVPGLSAASTTVIVAPDRAGSYTNAAAVVANQLDPNTLNNAARASAAAVVPALVVADAAVTEGDVGPSPAAYFVRLTTFSSQPVWLRYASANGTALSNLDYQAVSGLLLIPPGATNAEIPIPILGDRLNEANKTFTLSFGSATNATLPDPSAIVTIADNDPLPVLTIDNLAVPEGDSGTNIATLIATLSAPSGRAVSVNFATANGTAISGSDYVARATTALNFPAGSTSQPVAVGVRGDTGIESNETVFVNLSTPTNLILATNRAVITILDDDFRFATIAVVGRDVVLRFNTLAGQSNRVEWTGELAPASVWTPVIGATNVPGNGSVVQIIELDGGAQPQRFYRIRRLP